MALRQQSAVEFISTYSFAIFIISIILVAATSIALSVGSTPPVYNTCSIQPLITCQQTLLTYNSVAGKQSFTFIVTFRNNLGFLLQFPPNNAITLSASGLATTAGIVNNGICTPTLAGQGSQVLCKVHISGSTSLKQGSNTYTQFHIYYGLCLNQSASSCTANTLNVTGFSYQTLSPPTTNLYNVTVSSQNGIVVINGLDYFNNSVVYLSSGTYQLYAQPSVGYHFVSWSWTGNAVPGTSWSTSGPPFANSIGANTLTANTMFTVNTIYNSANIVALFSHN